MEFLIRLSECANCGTTDATLWVKYSSPDGISADSSFVPTTLALAARHPHFVHNDDYRVGIRRDLTRHLLLLLRDGHVHQARSDAALILDHFGYRGTAALLVSGTKEIFRRAMRRPFRRRHDRGDEIPAPKLQAARSLATERS
jgi:hypothetical protein